MTCCQIGARLPWMRCDRCTCRGCSVGDIPALVVLRARAAPHRGGRPGHGPPPAPARPPACGALSGPRFGTHPRRRAARIRRPSPGPRPFAPALCGCLASALLFRRYGAGPRVGASLPRPGPSPRLGGWFCHGYAAAFVGPASPDGRANRFAKPAFTAITPPHTAPAAHPARPHRAPRWRVRGGLRLR